MGYFHVRYHSRVVNYDRRCLIRSATVQILPIHSLSNWVLNGSYYWAVYVRKPLPLPSISIYVSAVFACGKVVKHAVTFG